MRVLFLTLLMASTAAAQTRPFAGNVSTRWQTEGKHGHDQPRCGTADCDERDFDRGNLDDSIGVRAGVERDLRTIGRTTIVGALEATLLSSEYNIDQDDVTIGLAGASIGARVPLGPLRLGTRAGAGPFATSDGNEAGALWFLEASVSAGPFRFAQRRTNFIGGPSLNDTAIMIEGRPPHGWELGSYAGVSDPGGDRALSQAEFQRLAAFRELPWHQTRLQIAWTGTAHESSLESTFLGYPGNFRTKVIDSYGAGLRRTHRLDAIALHYGASLEVADWEDDHELLDGEPEGFAAGVALAAGIRFRLSDAVAIETNVERVTWIGIDVGEIRYSAGIVLTP